MTATDELRKMLDERGVEWTYADGTVSFANNGHWCHAWAYSDNAMCISMGYFTPEQAIAATLGNGTCRNEWAEFGKFRCSNCWLQVNALSTNTTQPMPIRYCPSCGKAVSE